MTLGLAQAQLSSGNHETLYVADGHVVAAPPDRSDVIVEELAGHVLMPSFVEPHVHLDKAFTRSGVDHVGGTLDDAMRGFETTIGETDRDGLRARARRVLRLLQRRGTTSVRAHVGCGHLTGVSWIEEIVALRDESELGLDLQVVAHVASPRDDDSWDGAIATVRDALAAGADLVGGNPFRSSRPAEGVHQLAQAAVDHAVDLDLHIDETTDPASRTITDLADWVLAEQPNVDITAGHVVSLAALDPAEADEVAARVAAAGIHVVCLPLTNLYLQGRNGPRPGTRGLTDIDRLREAGVVVAAGNDNLHDAFNPVGRADPLEVASLLVTAGHQDPADALKMVTAAARVVVGLPPSTLAVGDVADLVAIKGGSLGEVLALAPEQRRVWRRGIEVAATTTTTWCQAGERR